MRPQNNVSNRAGYEDVARVETSGPLTVVVRFKEASAPFVREFCTHLGKPKIRKIVGRFISDENVAENGLRTHDVDWRWGASTIAYRRLRSVPTLHTALIRYNAYYGVMMNNVRPVFRDRRVRQAISAAVHRALLVRKVAFGAADVADADLPSFYGRTIRVSRRAGRPGARAALAADGGYVPGALGVLQKNGKPLALLLVFGTGSATAQAMVIQVQAQLRAVGIAVRLKAFDSNELFAPAADDGVLARGNFDLDWSGYFQSDDPDDTVTFVCRNFPPRGSNDARYCDPAFDAAEVAATLTDDPVARKRAYTRVERIIADDAPWAFVWWPRLPQIYDTDFKGYEVRPGFQSLDPQTWSIGSP